MKSARELKENKASWFDVKVLQAINKQVEELGWNKC